MAYIQILNMHLWEEYANIHATYKVPLINDVSRLLYTDDEEENNAGHRMVNVPQPVYIYGVGHLPKSVKKITEEPVVGTLSI